MGEFGWDLGGQRICRENGQGTGTVNSSSSGMPAGGFGIRAIVLDSHMHTRTLHTLNSNQNFRAQFPHSTRLHQIELSILIYIRIWTGTITSTHPPTLHPFAPFPIPPHIPTTTTHQSPWLLPPLPSPFSPRPSHTSACQTVPTLSVLPHPTTRIQQPPTTAMCPTW